MVFKVPLNASVVVSQGSFSSKVTVAVFCKTTTPVGVSALTVTTIDSVPALVASLVVVPKERVGLLSPEAVINAA
jgi:hypothetical protein